MKIVESSMKERDDFLQKMRPVLDLPDLPAEPVARFQHEVLRPVLKLQNPLLLRGFAAYLTETKTNFARLDPAAQAAAIEQALKTHKRLRATFFGLVAACMTVAEYEFYLAHQRDLHKRMTLLLIKRLQDQTVALLAALQPGQ